MDVRRDGSIRCCASVRSSRGFQRLSARAEPSFRANATGSGRGRHARLPPVQWDRDTGAVGFWSSPFKRVSRSRCSLWTISGPNGAATVVKNGTLPKRKRWRHVSRRQPARRLWLPDLAGWYGPTMGASCVVGKVGAVRCRESSDDSRRDRSRMFDGDPGRSCHAGKRNELQLCCLEQRVGSSPTETTVGGTNVTLSADGRGTHPGEHHV